MFIKKFYMSRKIISYTLYGNDKRYLDPLFENARNLDKYYPGWIMYVYHDRTVKAPYLNKLSNLGVILHNVEKSEIPPKLWRYMAVLDQNNEYVIFRDADSSLSLRESILVNEWIKSEYSYHIMRDHPLHIAPIMAGMFGAKKSGFPRISKIIQNKNLSQLTRSYDYDQVLLADFLYPDIYTESMIHTSFFKFKDEVICKIDPVDDYIGAIACDKNASIKEDSLLFKPTPGIPYYLARMLRYRVRPVLYASNFYGFLKKIINI